VFKGDTSPKRTWWKLFMSKVSMPSIRQELTLRLKTILEGDYKALDPGTALSAAVSFPLTTLCTDTHHGFAFPPENKSRDKKQSG